MKNSTFVTPAKAGVQASRETLDSRSLLPACRDKFRGNDESHATPKDLLKALEERFRLYQVLEQEGLVNHNKAQTIRGKIASAMEELETILKNLKET